MSNSIFEEHQAFRKNVLSKIVAAILSLLALFIIVALFTKVATPREGVPILLGEGILLVLLGTFRLDTVMDDECISYRFFPLQRVYRKINKADIARVAVVSYDPIRDYGGWGIRYGSKGKAYTVRGRQGISVDLKNGKNILIGTVRPVEAEEFLLPWKKS